MEYIVDTKMSLPPSWTYDRLLAKVKAEKEDSQNYTDLKRQRKRDQLKLYVNQEKNPE